MNFSRAISSLSPEIKKFCQEHPLLVTVPGVILIEAGLIFVPPAIKVVLLKAFGFSASGPVAGME